MQMRPLCVLAIVGLAAALALPWSYAADGDDGELPSLRRVQIPADRLGAELERIKQGVLVQMPRSEFEAKWERASKAAAAQQNPPRLVEGRYSAVLADTSLVRGTGQWRRAEPGRGTRHPSPATSQPRLAERPASAACRQRGNHPRRSRRQVARPPRRAGGRAHRLVRLVPPRHSLARGDSLRRARVPACAVATLELRLPADRAVAARYVPPLRTAPRRDGRHAPLADRFRRPVAGRSADPADDEARPGAAPRARAGRVPSRDRARRRPRRLRFRPGIATSWRAGVSVRVRSGSAPLRGDGAEHRRALESWGIRSEAPGRPTVFAARLREPFQDSTLPLKLQVRCWTSLTDRLWTCPEVRPVGALVRSERLALRVHPDIRLDEWQAGTFAFTTDAETPATPGTKPRPADGWQSYTLINQGSLPNGPRGRPRAPRRPADAAISSPAARLVADRHAHQFPHLLDHLRGRARPAVSAPSHLAGRVDRQSRGDRSHRSAAELDGVSRRRAKHAERGPEPAPGACRPASRRRSRGCGSSCCRRRRGPCRWRGGPWRSPTSPRGADTREGGLAISFGPLLEGRVNVSASAGPAEEKGPWGRQIPDSYHAYRGMPVVGSVVLRPHRTQFRARVTSEVVLTADGAVRGIARAASARRGESRGHRYSCCRWQHRWVGLARGPGRQFAQIGSSAAGGGRRGILAGARGPSIRSMRRCARLRPCRRRRSGA